jgi:hypothetical protein
LTPPAIALYFDTRQSIKKGRQVKNLLLLGRIPLVALLSLCLTCTGCSTLRPVDIPASITQESLPAVKAGDYVEIVLRSGGEKKFRVTAVTVEGVQGKNDYVAYADITLLEVRKVSALRTGGVVLGAIAAVAVIGFAILMSAYLSGEEE